MSLADNVFNTRTDVTAYQPQSQHREFDVVLDNLRLSDGGEYDVTLKVTAVCWMDANTVYALRTNAEHHRVTDWRIMLGPVEMIGTPRVVVEAIWRDFFASYRNRSRVLELCRKANGETR